MNQIPSDSLGLKYHATQQNKKAGEKMSKEETTSSGNPLADVKDQAAISDEAKKRAAQAADVKRYVEMLKQADAEENTDEARLKKVADAAYRHSKGYSKEDISALADRLMENIDFSDL